MSTPKSSVQSIESAVRELKELYPSPLPPLDLETKPDDTKFTLPEKVSLRNSWRLYEREQFKISRDFFINFYTENEMCIERYRSKNGKLNTKSLVHHSKWVQQVIKNFITIGFQSNGHIESVLQNFVICHRAHSIPQEDVILYTNAIQDHFFNWFNDIVTPTLKNSFEKLFKAILEAHEAGQRRSSFLPVDIADY